MSVMSAKLLIVDDEPATVQMIETFIQINGYSSATAYSGTDGLTMLELEKPDLVILDLMMPDMEGFEVCQRMRASDAFKSTPILIISARTDQDAIDRAYASGANGYLTKPFQLPELLSEIERLVN